MRELGIGIIGSGFMGLTYAETLSKYTQNARLIALALGTRAEGLALGYECKWEPEVMSLLGRSDLDAVIICSPPHLHLEHALAAAHARKHVLLEKPMATSVKECELILEAVENAGVNLMIAFTQRFRLCNREAKRIMSTGQLGRVRIIEEKQVIPNGYEHQPEFQKQPRNRGTTFAHGVHNIDRIRWLTGQEIGRVSAVAKTFHTTSIETSTVSIFELEAGAIGTFLCTYDCPNPGFADSLSHCRIIGERGLLILDAYGELKISFGNTWNTIAVQEPIDFAGEGKLARTRMEAYQLQVQEFIDSILQGRMPSVSGRDGWAATRIAEALYESSDQGVHVELKW